MKSVSRSYNTGCFIEYRTIALCLITKNVGFPKSSTQKKNASLKNGLENTTKLGKGVYIDCLAESMEENVMFF